MGKGIGRRTVYQSENTSVLKPPEPMMNTNGKKRRKKTIKPPEQMVKHTRTEEGYIMIERIKAILGELGIEEYKLEECRTESAELFFIKKELDLHRTTSIRECRLTVYRNFDHDGEKCKGESVATISAGMNDNEIRKVATEAYEAAYFVYMPYYELPDGEKKEIVGNLGMNGKAPADVAGIMTAALFKEDIYEKTFINSAELFVTETTKRIVNSKGIDVGYVSGKIEGEFVVQCLEKGDVETYESFTYFTPEPDALSEKVKETIEKARIRAQAVKMDIPENTDIIIDGTCFGEVLHYYTGRAFAGMIYEEYSEYKKGTDVGSRISVDLKAVFPYDDNGVPLEDRPLIKDGIVDTIYGGVKECYYLGIPCVGDYGFYSVKPGEKTVKELRSIKNGADGKIKPYLRVLTFSDFQSSQMSGEFGGEIRLAVYFDGEKEIPVTGGSININLTEHRDFEFSKEILEDGGNEMPKEVRFFFH